MVRGQLSETYEAAAKGNDPDQRARETAFNLSMGGDENALKAGVRATGAGAARGEINRTEQEAEKRRKDTERAILLAALNAEIAELDFQIGVGEDFLNDLRAGKAPELDDDGSLKNKDREKIIKDYEDRTGNKVDRTDIDALEAAAAAQIEEMKRRIAGLESKKSDYESTTKNERTSTPTATLDNNSKDRVERFEKAESVDVKIAGINDDMSTAFLAGGLGLDKPTSSSDTISAASFLDGDTSIGDGVSLKDQFDPAAAGMAAVRQSQEIAQAPSQEPPDHTNSGMDNGI